MRPLMSFLRNMLMFKAICFLALADSEKLTTSEIIALSDGNYSSLAALTEKRVC